MKCKACGAELQKIAMFGNTRDFYYYCNSCFVNGAKLGDCFSETFTEKESWRTGLNGHRSTGGGGHSMNKAENEALTALNRGEGHLHWVKIEGKELWLYISSYTGEVFKYNAEDDVMTGLKMNTIKDLSTLQPVNLKALKKN